ncbi:unnamed protein product [Closterium sp. NIES-54]
MRTSRFRTDDALWYQHLGHPSRVTVKSCIEASVFAPCALLRLDGTKVRGATHPRNCTVCPEATLIHQPFPLLEPGTNPYPKLHKVYNDFLNVEHCGINDELYRLTFVDVGTHVIFYDPGEKLKIWQSDGAAEFRSKELQDYLAQKGVCADEAIKASTNLLDLRNAPRRADAQPADNHCHRWQLVAAPEEDKDQGRHIHAPRKITNVRDVIFYEQLFLEQFCEDEQANANRVYANNGHSYATPEDEAAAAILEQDSRGEFTRGDRRSSDNDDEYSLGGGAGAAGGSGSGRGAAPPAAPEPESDDDDLVVRGGADGAAGPGGASAASAGGAGAAGTTPRRSFFYPQLHSSLPPPDSVLRQVLSLPSSTGLPLPLMCPLTDQSQPQLLPSSLLPTPAPHTERVVLPEPPTSSLPYVPNPESDLGRAASPTVTRLLANVVTDPDLESTAAFALVTELVEFAARSHLDYVASLVTESESVCPPSVGGEHALSNPDALDIPTLRSYAEAITGEYSFQWQTAMDTEMASWKSTGTYIDEVPPPGANIVDGMCIFKVKRSPGSLPAFKARYVAPGFSQQQGVDFFHTFSPTPKMTTLRVLLHVAAQCDYELHSLDFSNPFLHGSLHEEIWLRRPPGFTGSFPAGTQCSLWRPVYGLRQALQEWNDTLRTTLGALGFAPSSADPSLFLRTDTTLPPFYVLVYVDDLVFASGDIEALALVKAELQERHTCTDLGPSALRLPVLLAIAHSSVYRPFAISSTFGRVRRAEWSVPRHRPEHWEAAKRMLRYLCSTSGMGLVLGGQSSVVLTGNSDASWADDQATQRSSQGYTFSLGFGSVSWRSTCSSSVLSSSCEAEIYAGAMAAQQLCWLTYLLTDLGERPRSPPVQYVDNKAILALCHEQRVEHRTKHIALRYFHACELQQRRQVHLSYVASRANTADVFPKALGSGDHQRFCTALGLVPTLPHLLVA